MCRTTFLVVTALAASTAAAQPPAGYYDSANPASATVLRSTLHEIVDDHTRFRYTANTTDTWDILKRADQDPADSTRVLDVYRNASFPKAEGGNDNYNREHSWPKSYGFPDDRVSNYPYTDCHALFLADSRYNSSRNNKPYRACDSGCTEKTTEVNAGAGGGAGVFDGNSNWTETGTWLTWGRRRGDVARALFYMDVRYAGGLHGVTSHPEPDLILTNDLSLVQTSGNNATEAHMGQLSVLLAWHHADPVDDLERQHTEAVFQHQGNRNPFVDHPEWVACIFEDQCPAVPPAPGAPTLTLDQINEQIAELERQIAELGVQLAELRAQAAAIPGGGTP